VPHEPSSASAVLGVIPARYGATRFPGKPLAVLWGKPILQHVWERARQVEGLDALVIATDDARIAEAAKGFGAEVEMTSPSCASGTDRVAEVVRHRMSRGIVLNLQGDEPELDAAAVTSLVAGMRAEVGVRMATLAHAEEDRSLLESSEVVKVSIDPIGFARYFTRRWPPPGKPEEALRHVGVYGFRAATLLEFASWPPSRNEREERLEQLRALDRGVRVRVYLGGRAFSGVDTPEQLEALERRGPRT